MAQQGFQWKNLPVIIMVAFLVLSFALFGVGDAFSTVGRNTVAKVGSETVSGVEWSRAFQNVKDQYGRIFGEITPELEQAFNMQGMALEQVVEEKIFAQEAARQGIGASEAEVKQAIAKNPNFLEDGRFSKEKFQSFLKNNRLNEAEYGDSIFKQVAQARLRSLTTVDGGIPDALVQQVLQARGQQRDALLLAIAPIEAGAIATPDDATLTPFYEDNRALYNAPEYREISYIVLEAADYNTENLEGEALNDLAYETSVQLEDAVGGGASLEEIAAQFKVGLHKTQPITAAGVGKHEGPLHVTENRSLPAFGEFLPTLFGLEQGQESGVVLSDDGTSFYLAVPVVVTESYPLSFEEAKPELITAWKMAEAETQTEAAAAQHATALQQALADAPEVKTATQYARTHKLAVDELEKQYRGDVGKQQDTPKNVLDALFALSGDAVEATEAVKLEDGSYAIAVFTATHAANVDDPTLGLEATKNRLSQQMQREQQSQYVEYLKTRYPVRYTFSQNNSE